MTPSYFPPELLTNAEMAEADRLTIAGGAPGHELMEHAGAAVALEASRLAPRHGRIAVLCGPGNNGGDGFVAARLLKQRGDSSSSSDCSAASRRCAATRLWRRRPGTASSRASNSVPLDAADLAIDALFGAGLARDLDGRGARGRRASQSMGARAGKANPRHRRAFRH